MLKTLRANVYWNLRVLLTPDCWWQNYEYSRDWDAQLIAYMAFFEFKKVDEFSITMNDIEIWVANHPYASFSPHPLRRPNPMHIRPSRKTILMAMDKVMKDIPGFNPYDP